MDQNGQNNFAATADVGAQRVAHVYAEALLNAADKQRQTDAVLEQFDSLVADVFGKDPQFETFLASGSVSRETKAKVLHSIFDQSAVEVFGNFLQVLNQHERLNLLRPILAAARAIHNQRSGRVPVEVRSAVALPDDLRQRLQQQLQQSLHKEPVLETRVDPDILGGMVVRVGDWLYDGSVRTRLETLRNQLIARSSHEIQSGRDRFSTPVGN
jgi:F-type H+-transporting ATPase subunit delta